MNVRRLLYGATFILAVASTALAVDAFFTYLDLRNPPAVTLIPPSVPSKTPAGQKSQARDYTVIVRRDLFAAEPQSPEKVPAPAPVEEPPRAAAPAPPSRTVFPGPVSTKFRLVGTTVFPDGGGYAILEDMDSKQQSIHRQGDTVQGATIERVRRGEVRLVIEGRPEVLSVFEEKEAKGSLAEQPVPPGPNALSSPKAPTPNVPPGTNPPSPASPQTVLPREQVARVVEQPKDHFRTEPYGQPGGLGGVRIFPLRPGGVFQMMGLQPSDVVLSVDGNAVKTESELFAAMSRVLERGGSTVEILRSGNKLNLSFQIQ